MFKDLLIHPLTKKSLEAAINQSIPLLLVGPEGSGKAYTASLLAQNVLGLNSQPQLKSYAHYLLVERVPDKQDITVDQVRQIINFLKLRTSGKKQTRRVIVIKDAPDMNEEAQNALLKILEEPPADTLFILTAVSKMALLPTIVSRTQPLEIKPVKLETAFKYFEAEFSQQEIESAWQLSRGSVGLMASLLRSDDHELKKAIESGKLILSKPPYQRLIEIENRFKSRAELGQLLSALELILASLHRTAISKHKEIQAKKILNDRKLVLKLKQYLAANCSLKLVMSELTLKLNI